MALAIKAENLSKLYRLGEIGTGTLTGDLQRWAARVRGKEDEFLKIGEANDRTSKGTSDFVWSLKDLNFEVEQGTAVGIIGRNGAGKSTLLKLLSRVTSPTKGSIRVKGRIASLLEVGTGFHPELTGRENIFLNGAILGMRQLEIKKRFDEIVSFAGVERYVDTPVKRYSSGMYVRLAFAVAAHLESEILIVDEVLAVGDLEFQKKCLGRMGEASASEGRTVLFVSHNMSSVQTLCSKGILLVNGTIGFSGSAKTAVDMYVSKAFSQLTDRKWAADEAPGNSSARLLQAKVYNTETKSTADFHTDNGFAFEFTINNLSNNKQFLDFTYHLVDESGVLIYVGSTATASEPTNYNQGIMNVVTSFPANILNQGIYTVSRLLFVLNRGTILTEWNDVLTFEVRPNSLSGDLGFQAGKEGVINQMKLPWKVDYLN
jgi:lipopolysaccharide transport system ATP-binding protein